MKKSVALAVMALLLSACDTQVKDFVRGVDAGGTSDQPSTPPNPVGASIKVSPGSVVSQSTSMSLRATVTPTNVRTTSAALSMTVGISKRSR